MSNNCKTFLTCFEGQSFELQYDSQEILGLLTTLFTDFQLPTRSSQSPVQYCLSAHNSQPGFSLRQGEKKLYKGDSKYKLAYALMNDVIFHCINKNEKFHTIHAGAVCNNKHCIVMPGSSGKGKSTLTAWLVSQGYQYLTDELVFFEDSGRIRPFSRPINFKVKYSEIAWMFKDDAPDKKEIISDDNGSMIPHRFFNSCFVAQTPLVTNFIFPEYKTGAKLQIDELSPAKSSLYLMQSHVNARNLSGHGVSEIADIVRGCTSHRLQYGSFAGLLPALKDLFIN